MDKLQQIYEIIDREGITNVVVQEIDKYIEDIQNGTEDFSRFNLSEHAGLCTAGAPLIGASIIACYATASLTASSNVAGSKGCPTNWEIDKKKEKLIKRFRTLPRDFTFEEVVTLFQGCGFS